MLNSTTAFRDEITAASAPDPGSPAPQGASPAADPPEASSADEWFPRSPGETPRALNAFRAYFDLGHGRTLQAVAEALGENSDTVRRWSSRHKWTHRIQSFQSGLLRQQAETEAALRLRHAENLARRTAEVRELEWEAARKLSTVANCYLENVGDREIESMNLGQASRALQAASRLARLALSDPDSSEEPPLAPIQIELAAALKQAYSQPPAPEPPVAGPAAIAAAATARN